MREKISFIQFSIRQRKKEIIKKERVKKRNLLLKNEIHDYYRINKRIDDEEERN